jgi:mannitol/fructose-specific phosphotransferase system IIA component (Ntr-type)
MELTAEMLERELTRLRERMAEKNRLITMFVHYFERDELITPAQIQAAKAEALLRD